MTHPLPRTGNAHTAARRAVRTFAWLTAFMLAAFFSNFAPAVQAETGQIEETTVQRVGIKIEYPVSDSPQNVAWQGPGLGWFTSPSEDLIGLITRTSSSDDELISVSIQYLAEPNDSKPYDILYDNDTVWFTAMGSDQLGRIDLAYSGSTVIPQPTQYYPMPTAGSGPAGIVLAPDGIIWIVSANLPLITRFDPATEIFTEWSYEDRMPAGSTVSSANNYPDIATNHPNQLWFTVPGADMMVGYEVDIDDFSIHRLNNPFFGAREPAGITVDAKPNAPWDGGYPWVASYASNVVGRFAPGTNAGWDWFFLPTPDSRPRGIAFKDNGASWDIWFTQANTNRVGRLMLLPNYDRVAFINMALPAGSSPHGIVTAGDDTVWFAESGRRTVSEIRPPYVEFTRLPYISVAE